MAEEWSDWLDFNESAITSVPEASGVCVMHASMKVLFIGGSGNIRGTLVERLSNECSSKAKRFRYLLTSSSDSVKEGLLKEYAEKHAGKLPLCNEGG